MVILFIFQVCDALEITSELGDGWHLAENIETKKRINVHSESIILREQSPSEYENTSQTNEDTSADNSRSVSIFESSNVRRDPMFDAVISEMAKRWTYPNDEVGFAPKISYPVY